MNKTVLNASMALVMVSVGLTGCSRGPLYQGSGGGAAAAVVSGKVVDGYVGNATVTLDLNDDRVCSASEPKTTTDSNGDYKFTAGSNGVPAGLTETQIKSHIVCAKGGIDLASGAPVVGELMAPPGGGVITPLTSLVMARLNASNPPPATLTASQISSASSGVAADLGIVGGTDLLNADPVALASANPGLLQKTEAVSALLAQTVAVIGAAGSGGVDSQVTDAVKSALFAKALASLTQVLTTSKFTTAADLGAIASNVLAATTTAAKADKNLPLALTALKDIEPNAVAAFAAPSLTAMATAVVNAPVAVLGTPSAVNPMFVVVNSEVLANAVGALSTSLLTTTSGVNIDKLKTIATAALDGNNVSGVVTVLRPSDIQKAISDAGSSITLTDKVLADLGNANLLNNVIRVENFGVNCSSSVDGSCQAITVNDKPYQAYKSEVANIDSISVKFGAIVGNPLVNSGNGSLIVSIAPTSSDDPSTLSLSLDKIVLTQNNTTGSISVSIPADAVLTVNGYSGKKTATAKLDGSAISSLVTSDEANKTIKLDVKNLQIALGGQNKSFNALSALLNPSKSTKKTFRFQTGISALSMAIGPALTPLRTNVYTVDITFK